MWLLECLFHHTGGSWEHELHCCCLYLPPMQHRVWHIVRAQSILVEWVKELKSALSLRFYLKLWDSKAGSAFPLTSVLETLSSLISLVFVSLWRFLLLFYLQLLPLLHTISFLSPALHVGRTEMADTCHICTWLCQQVLYGLCPKQWCLLSSLLHSCLHSHLLSGFCCFPMSLNSKCSSHTIFSFLCSELNPRSIFL